jgi:hypothetical protein
MPIMAFRTEAPPTHLCNNYKQTEPLNLETWQYLQGDGCKQQHLA